MGGWNALKQGMNEAASTGQAYNALTGKMRTAVGKVGKYKPPVAPAGRVLPSGAAGFADLWSRAGTEQKVRWLGMAGSDVPRDQVLFLLKQWNDGMIDGMRHNMGLREMFDIVGYDPYTQAIQ